jgi:arylsulfatase A-like enzyme
VVFFSDNGAPPNARNDDALYPDGAKYPPGPAGGTNLPLRGQKTQLYDGGIRVPALAYWPGKLKPGRCEQVMHAADWMPTLCRLAGHTPEKDLKWDGRDVWPQVAGEKTAEPRMMYWAGVGFRSQAVRDGDWKLIVQRAGKGGKEVKESPELFDMARDPSEKQNLAADQPAKVEELKRLLAKLAANDNDAKPGQN